MQNGRALQLCIIFGIFASYLTLSQSKVNSTCWEGPLGDDELIPKYFWHCYVPRETSFIIPGVVSSLDEHGQICIRRQWLTALGTPQDKRPHNITTGLIYSPGTKFSEFLALIPCSINASMSYSSPLWELPDTSTESPSGLSTGNPSALKLDASITQMPAQLVKFCCWEAIFPTILALLDNKLQTTRPNLSLA